MIHSDKALKSVHRGFWIGSAISVIGFFALGIGYLHFTMETFGAEKIAAFEQAGYWAVNPYNLPWFANFGIVGLDLRPAITCLIGVFLAIALNKVTSYYTHTGHAPVRSLVKACTTGHATNIIQGFAVGYESTVAALLVIAVAILLSVSDVCRHSSALCSVWRRNDRYRYVDLNRQHDLDGRVRTSSRQCEWYR